jgi:hypothetical protein
MVSRHPCPDVMEETRAQGMCGEETCSLSQWVTTDLGGAAEEDTEVGMSYLQSGAVSGVFKEPLQPNDTVMEIKLVGKGKELELAAADIYAINGAVSYLFDTERPLNNRWVELVLEDVSAIT